MLSPGAADRHRQVTLALLDVLRQREFQKCGQLVEEVVRVLRSANWVVATEVSFNEFGERGSIDVLAFHRETRSLLVIEVKTTIADAQDLQASLDRKVRLARKIAADRGWHARSVAKVLVLVDTRANRQRVGVLSATFTVTFPSRTWAVRRWVANPSEREPLRGIWFLRIGSQAVVTQRVRRRSPGSTHAPRPRTGIATHGAVVTQNHRAYRSRGIRYAESTRPAGPRGPAGRVTLERLEVRPP